MFLYRSHLIILWGLSHTAQWETPARIVLCSKCVQHKKIIRNLWCYQSASLIEKPWPYECSSSVYFRAGSLIKMLMKAKNKGLWRRVGALFMRFSVICYGMYSITRIAQTEIHFNYSKHMVPVYYKRGDRVVNTHNTVQAILFHRGELRNNATANITQILGHIYIQCKHINTYYITNR